MTDNAAAAGIRGLGMINQIQQNTQGALATEGAKLSAKQSVIDVSAAHKQGDITDKLDNRNRLAENRTDQMLERGQALRSQSAAEIGAGASVVGKAMDQGFKDVMSAAKGGSISGDDGSNELSSGGPKSGGFGSNSGGFGNFG